MKFWLKSCRKCGGDLEGKMDITGPYIECVQCGGELTPREQCALVKKGYVPAGLNPLVAPPVLVEGRRQAPRTPVVIG